MNSKHREESEDEENRSTDLPLRKAMPDEVDERTLQMWIKDFLYVSPPEADRNYSAISWVQEDDRR